MSVLEKQLDDFLEMVKKQLKTYANQLVKEQYHDLYKEHQKMIAKMAQIESDIKKLKEEKEIIWE